MLRQFHAVPALVAALLLLVLGCSGAVLSVFPAQERAQARDATGLDVATLAGRVSAQVPGVQTLVRRPSGVIVAYHAIDASPQASVIDPASGRVLAAHQVPAFERWIKNLHRRLLLGDTGRAAAGVGAAAMLFIVLAGLLLLARRMGGWRRLASPVRGDTLQRLHDRTARVVVTGLALSAATGLLMSLLTFGWLPEGGAADPLADAQADARATASRAMPMQDMPPLRAVPVERLRQLKWPNPDDRTDVIELETLDGLGAIDPATGRWLAYAALDPWQRLHATVRMLHTGEGLWWLALLLGAAASTVPLLVITGTLSWLRRRRARPRWKDNAAAQQADTVLLVGSDGNTTWGFALALHEALVRAGRRVHMGPMDSLAPRYRAARHLLVLAASQGDGDAPENAGHFLQRLARTTGLQGLPFAVLGFGDRQYPRFCGYAFEVHQALVAAGCTPLREPGTVDRQSEPDFRRWCEALGPALGTPALELHYTPRPPPSTELVLLSRTDYGTGGDAPTAVLRFAPAAPAGPWARWRRRAWPAFETGDLLGVLPPGGAAARYYSLASAASDGVLEICVRRHPGGLCSSHLAGLQPGDSIRAFVRPHEAFRPAAGAAPVILVGAGTGIGPLIGFIRHNQPQRPMHLYFGARDAEDGFLYRDELQGLVADRRLRSLSTAFSRSAHRAYVQDRLLADAARLRALVAQGAQVMVCGGRAMAAGVAEAWERILGGSGLSVALLRSQGRYVEDVY